MGGCLNVITDRGSNWLCLTFNQKTITENVNKSRLKRNINRVGASAGEEKRNGDREDQEIKSVVTVQSFTRSPLNVEFCSREDGKDKCRNLCPKTGEQEECPDDLNHGI